MYNIPDHKFSAKFIRPILNRITCIAIIIGAIKLSHRRLAKVEAVSKTGQFK